MDECLQRLVREYLKTGSEDVAAELLARFGGMVYSVARNILQDTDAVEDAYQETWLKVFASLATLREHSQIAGWIKAIAARTALDHLRKRRHFLPLHDARLREPSTDPEQVAGIDVRRAVSELPIHYRSVVVLYYFLDFSCAEIAEVLGVVDGTVMSRLHKARQILAAQLGSHYGEESQ